MMDSAPTRATPIRPSFPKLLDCSEPHLVSPNDFSDYVQEGHDADESQTQDQDHELPARRGSAKARAEKVEGGARRADCALTGLTWTPS